MKDRDKGNVRDEESERVTAGRGGKRRSQTGHHVILKELAQDQIRAVEAVIVAVRMSDLTRS